VGRAIWELFYFQLFRESGDFAWSSLRSLLLISMETTHDYKEPVLLIALKTMLHAKLCLLVTMYLICVSKQPRRVCQCHQLDVTFLSLAAQEKKKTEEKKEKLYGLRTSWTPQRKCTKISATFSKEPLLLSASSFWMWVAQSTTLAL